MEGMILVFLLGLLEFFLEKKKSCVEYIIVCNKWFEFTDSDFIISVRLVEILPFYHDSYYL